MIKLEHVVLASPEQMSFIIQGLRNPMNSHDRSDSKIDNLVSIKDGSTVSRGFDLGDNDHSLMQRLAKAGTDHRKFMRMMPVYVRITAPLYFWKEFDTYKVATVANSCSTMHKIHAKEFTLEDFSTEQLYYVDQEMEDYIEYNKNNERWGCVNPMYLMHETIGTLNYYRERYLKTKDKKYWWQMIQLLPSSYNQTRNVMMNYEVLANIYKSRKNHKLDCWREFCTWIESLPYSELICGPEFLRKKFHTPSDFKEYDTAEYGKEHPEFVDKITKLANEVKETQE